MGGAAAVAVHLFFPGKPEQEPSTLILAAKFVKPSFRIPQTKVNFMHNCVPLSLSGSCNAENDSVFSLKTDNSSIPTEWFVPQVFIRNFKRSGILSQQRVACPHCQCWMHEIRHFKFMKFSQKEKICAFTNQSEHSWFFRPTIAWSRADKDSRVRQDWKMEGSDSNCLKLTLPKLLFHRKPGRCLHFAIWDTNHFAIQPLGCWKVAGLLFLVLFWEWIVRNNGMVLVVVQQTGDISADMSDDTETKLRIHDDWWSSVPHRTPYWWIF